MTRVERIGDATLYLARCEDVLPTLSGVDAVVTDPPYGIGFAAHPTKWQRRAGLQPQAWDDATVELVATLAIGSRHIIWGGNNYALPPSRCWLAWHKPDAPPSMGQIELAWTDLGRPSRHISWSISATNAERVGHPTQKPIAVMEWCVNLIGDCEAIADPFMGSGTTGVACMRAGIRFIGVETEEKYFDIACRRIEQAHRQRDLFVHAPPATDPAEARTVDLFAEPEAA